MNNDRIDPDEIIEIRDLRKTPKLVLDDDGNPLPVEGGFWVNGELMDRFIHALGPRGGILYLTVARHGGRLSREALEAALKVSFPASLESTAIIDVALEDGFLREETGDDSQLWIALPTEKSGDKLSPQKE